MKNNSPATYEQAGVSTEAGRDFVRNIARAVESTHGPNVLSARGGFAGLLDVSFLKDFKNPVLVSGTDGVGTKLRLAILFDDHSSVGIDLVAMCANDVLVTGARAMFFLDYIACGKLHKGRMQGIVESIAEGCKRAGCALLGGETAEHPGTMPADDYDLAGFVTGAVEKESMITGEAIRPGHVLIGVPSSGIHSNGLSLVRKLFLKDGLELPDDQADRDFLKNEILTPTIIYEPVLRPLLDAPDMAANLHGIVHVTGGGFYENIPRILPAGTRAVLDREAVQPPALFKKIAERGNMEEQELYGVFNMGIGLIIACPADAADDLVTELKKHAHKLAPAPLGEIRVIGRVEELQGRVDDDLERVEIA